MPKKTVGNSVKKLLKLLSPGQKAYILIYGSPDPDGLASAWALREILQTYQVSADIGYTGPVGRPENEAMIEILRMPVNHVDLEKLTSADFVALVDCQPDFFQEFPLPRVDAVIDHHPKKKDFDAPFTDIRIKCMSTASILTEYMRELGIPISKRLATALIYGYITDARNMNRVATPTDQAALRILEKKFHRDWLRRIEFSHYVLKDLDSFQIALKNRKQAKNILFSHMGNVGSSDACVQVADFFIRVKDIQWALVSGIVDDDLIVVFRCDGHSKDAGKLANGAFGELGSAGGHRTMGRAEIPLANMPDGLKGSDSKGITYFVLSQLAKQDRAFRSVLRKLEKD